LTWLRNKLDEAGQGLVEYVLIIVLIAIAVIAILTILGGGGLGEIFGSPTPTP